MGLARTRPLPASTVARDEDSKAETDDEYFVPLKIFGREIELVAMRPKVLQRRQNSLTPLIGNHEKRTTIAAAAAATT